MEISWFSEADYSSGETKKNTEHKKAIAVGTYHKEVFIFSEVDESLWILTNMDANMYGLMIMLFPSRDVPIMSLKSYSRNSTLFYISYQFARWCAENKSTASDAMLRLIPEKAIGKAKHILDNLEVYKYIATSY